MKVIGLTGPSGAGKTVVASLFNYPTVNADLVARQVHKDPAVLAQLCHRFGADIVEDGTLNRVILASRAFATRKDTDDLNQIMHPAIFEKIQQELAALAAAGTPICLLDAPLLFEGGCEDLCHRVVCVLASRDVRKNRIIERDGMTDQRAEQRMGSQPDDDYYRSRCHYVLVNNGDISQLQADVEALRGEII